MKFRSELVERTDGYSTNKCKPVGQTDTFFAKRRRNVKKKNANSLSGILRDFTEDQMTIESTSGSQNEGWWGQNGRISNIQKPPFVFSLFPKSWAFALSFLFFLFICFYLSTRWNGTSQLERGLVCCQRRTWRS